MSQNINLYDPGLRLRRDLLGFEAVAAAIGAALLVIVIGAGLAQSSLSNVQPVATALNDELESQRAAMHAAATLAATRRPDAALLAEVARAQQTLLQRRSALQNIGAGGIGTEAGFSGRLEALARQSVDGLWLTSLLLRQDDVLLRGRAIQPALIPQYVQRLERESSLQGRTFKALEVNRPLAGDKPAAATATAHADGELASRAEFVEFMLIGPAGVPAPADRGAKP